jgi:precorrin-3B synthase
MIVRRGTCPGLADPMPTGDGLLARFAVGRAIPLDAFAALCAAAKAHGNGIMEITSRGSLQVRGLTPGSAPAFAEQVAVLGIADAAAERVLTNPLAGLDPQEIFDGTAIATRLREGLVESGLAAKLGPKVSVVIDGGGALHLAASRGDKRCNALSRHRCDRQHK